MSSHQKLIKWLKEIQALIKQGRNGTLTILYIRIDRITKLDFYVLKGAVKVIIKNATHSMPWPELTIRTNSMLQMKRVNNGTFYKYDIGFIDGYYNSGCYLEIQFS